MTPRQRFTILLRDGIAGLPIFPGNPYPQGEGLTGVGPNSLLLALNGDLGFRTYVETSTPVPEPSTILLMGGGLVALARRFRGKL